jgi:hypothetical protein
MMLTLVSTDSIRLESARDSSLCHLLWGFREILRSRAIRLRGLRDFRLSSWVFGSNAVFRKRFPFNNQSVGSKQQYTLDSRNGLLARNSFVGRLSRRTDEGLWHFEISPMRRRAFNSKDRSIPVKAFNNQPEKDRKSEGELDNSFLNSTISLEIHCS